MWGAAATVRRSGVDFTVTVPLKEYNTNDNVWKYKPETMIKKVAESQALSAAYPELLGGVYDDSEQMSIDSVQPKELAVPGGDEPATQAQIDNLKAQGYTSEDLTDITKAQAVKMLTSKPKAKKVEEAVKPAEGEETHA